MFDDSYSRELLAKLTVIVFSANRPKDLAKVLKYWSQWPVTILVLDGSDEPAAALPLVVGCARVLTFSEVSMNRRFRFAAAHIDTPYACLHSDDDFLLARAAARAIEYLDEKSEFIAVASDFYLFDNNRLLFAYEGRSVLAAGPEERLVEHFSDYRFSYFYGIQRSPQLATALTAVTHAADSPVFLEHAEQGRGYELGMELVGAALGRLGKNADVQLLKQVGNGGTSEGADAGENWLIEPEAQKAVLAWRSVLGSQLAQPLGVPSSTVELWLDEALSCFVKREAMKLKENEIRRGDIIGRIALKLKPESEWRAMPGWTPEVQLDPLARLWGGVRSVLYRVLRATFRAAMRIAGRPRVSSVRLAEYMWLDPRDMADVRTVLDEGYSPAPRLN